MGSLVKVKWSSNQRLDLPDLLNIESFACADWAQFFDKFVCNTSTIIKGFDISSPKLLVGGTANNGININIANSVMFHPTSAVAGGGFFVATTDAPVQSVSLSSNATNYIELDQTTSTGSPDLRTFWDPDKNNNAGGEFTQVVDTVTNLDVTVTVNTIGFTAGKIPIAKVVVNATPNIVSITDCRPLLFRLGSGGANPDALNDYTWPNVPAGFDRVDSPTTITGASAALTNPFQGSDKNIRNWKDWMDAVMTRFKELTGSAYWFSNSGLISGANIANLWWDTVGLWVTGTGRFKHDAGATLKWDSSIFVKSITGLYYFEIAANPAGTALSDEQILYVTQQRNVAFASGYDITWTNGSAVISGAAGAFAGLVIGDFIKKASDGIDKYVQILNFGGSPPATAVLVNAVTVYGGVTGVEQSTYAKSLYTVSLALRSAVPSNADIWWLAYRSDNTGIPRIYLRNSAELEQGEELQISDETSLDLLTFVGSTGEADYQPNYATDATDAKTGQTQYNATASENLTVRASKLTSMMADKAQDKNVKLANGGAISWTIGTTTLAWTADFLIEIPGSANNNTITAGNVVIPAGQCAYFSINRNASVAQALTVNTLANVPLNEKTFVLAYHSVADSKIYLMNGTAISPSPAVSLGQSNIPPDLYQDRNIILSGGGNLNLLGAAGISWSTPIIVTVPHIATATIAAGASGALAAGNIGYIDFTRAAGAQAIIIAAQAAVPHSANIESLFYYDGTSVFWRDGTRCDVGIVNLLGGKDAAVGAQQTFVTIVTGGAPWLDGDFKVTDYADATACIQAAVDYMKAKSGVIYIRAGTYQLIKAINFYGNTSLEILGDGAATIIELPNVARPIKVFTTNGNSDGVGTFRVASNAGLAIDDWVIISDNNSPSVSGWVRSITDLGGPGPYVIEIYDTPTAGGAVVNLAVYTTAQVATMDVFTSCGFIFPFKVANLISNITLRNFTVANSAGLDAIPIVGCNNEFITIDNITATSIKTNLCYWLGTAADPTDYLVVKNCHFMVASPVTGLGYCVYIQGYIDNSRIEDNTLTGNIGKGGIVLDDNFGGATIMGTNLWLCNNQIKIYENVGAVIASGILIQGWYRFVHVTNNDVRISGAVGNQGRAFEWNQGSCVGAVLTIRAEIIGNMFYAERGVDGDPGVANATSQGVAIYHATGGQNINDFVFVGNQVQANSVTTQYAGEFDRCTFVIISSNRFLGGATKSVRYDTITNSQIGSNFYSFNFVGGVTASSVFIIDYQIIKAWCTVGGGPGHAILGQWNISGLADLGAGHYRIDFDRDFPNTFYAVAVVGDGAGFYACYDNKLTSSVEVRLYVAGIAIDIPFSLMVIGVS